MDVTGKIIAVLPMQSGTSKTGNEWKKQEFVLETHEQYPKKICFQIFGGDRIDQAAIQPGEDLTIYFDVESREYNGRWFTNINAWKVDRATAMDASTGLTPDNFAPSAAPIASTPNFTSTSPADDLPF